MSVRDTETTAVIDAKSLEDLRHLSSVVSQVDDKAGLPSSGGLADSEYNLKYSELSNT